MLYQAKSFMFYNIWTTYWTFVSQNALTHTNNRTNWWSLESSPGFYFSFSFVDLSTCVWNTTCFRLHQWSGRFLCIITGWDPSDCKSNRLHVDILRFSFIKMGYIPHIPLNQSVIFLQSWTSTGYFSNSTGSSVTTCRFSLIIGLHVANLFFLYILGRFLGTKCSKSCAKSALMY